MLLLHLFSLTAGRPCDALDDWFFDCNETRGYHAFHCPADGVRAVNCSAVIACDGDPHRTRRISCQPTEGKNPMTALALSVFLGFLGADRFYLGYHTIGLMKLLTGGFFGLGWMLDIFMIALRIVKPAHGRDYMFKPGGGFMVRLPGPEFV